MNADSLNHIPPHPKPACMDHTQGCDDDDDDVEEDIDEEDRSEALLQATHVAFTLRMVMKPKVYGSGCQGYSLVKWPSGNGKGQNNNCTTSKQWLLYFGSNLV